MNVCGRIMVACSLMISNSHCGAFCVFKRTCADGPSQPQSAGIYITHSTIRYVWIGTPPCKNFSRSTPPEPHQHPTNVAVPPPCCCGTSAQKPPGFQLLSTAICNSGYATISALFAGARTPLFTSHTTRSTSTRARLCTLAPAPSQT